MGRSSRTFMHGDATPLPSNVQTWTLESMPKSGQNNFDAMRRNIYTVARIEEKHLTYRGHADIIADAVAAFSGSMTFVVLHIVVYTFWILINLKFIPFIPAFDPYPVSYTHLRAHETGRN